VSAASFAEVSKRHAVLSVMMRKYSLRERLKLFLLRFWESSPRHMRQAVSERMRLRFGSWTVVPIWKTLLMSISPRRIEMVFDQRELTVWTLRRVSA